MKRVLALILALISCITLLTACGDSGEKEPEGPADRLDAVLDRSNDAGKFTIRFFDYILYEDGSTTVRRKVGDSALITFPDGKLMLVDTATPTAGPHLARYLEDMGVTYLDYLLIYLLNNWLPRNAEGIGIFTLIFVILYAAIWICIYFFNRTKTNKLNKKLQERPAA